MSIVDIDLNALGDVIQEVTDTLLAAYAEDPQPHPTLNEPTLISDNLRQFVQIVQHVDAQQGDEQLANELPARLTDMDELGDYGLTLLDALGEWAELLGLKDVQVTLSELSIPVALWSARHIGHIKEIATVVNSLSKIANQTDDPDFLRELSGIMDEIANAVAPEVKRDPERTNPAHPWRILNLNHGIVATRTHDPQIMESVFEQIRLRLPDDAPAFFREGMEQMDSIGYPTHVRHVMEKYYQMTNNPTLH